MYIPTTVLNTFIFPIHKLNSKVGLVLTLVHNLSNKDGLCNGTSLQIVKLRKHSIAGKIVRIVVAAPARRRNGNFSVGVAVLRR